MKLTTSIFAGNQWATHFRHCDSKLAEIARVLVRLDHIASFIVNANHRIM